MQKVKEKIPATTGCESWTMNVNNQKTMCHILKILLLCLRFVINVWR